jgi:DNA-binding CsgD family transcriptional regulator
MPTRVLVGRERELRWLRDRLRPPGSGGIVLIEGEAGIGKSHLVLAATTGFPRWWIAFPSPRAGFPAHGLRVMGELAADRRLMGLLQETGDEDASKQRQAIFAAADALVVSTDRRIVVLDDIQWADGLTRDWLSRSGELLRRSSIWFVLTMRTGSPSRTAAERALAQLEPGLVHRLELGSLEADAVLALANELGSPTSDEEALELSENSGGNPLLVTELCLRRRRVQKGDSPGTHPYTRSLEQVVGEQLAELGVSARRVLSAAALAPQPAPETIVSVASGLERGRFEAAVGEALLSGLMEASAPGAVSFRHDLQREAIEQQLPLHERRRLHRRIAEALIASADATPMQVARQLIGAGDLVEGVEWLKRAGEHAMRCYDYSGAIEAFAESLHYCPPPDIDLVVALVEELVRAARLAAQPARGLDLLEHVTKRFADSPAAGHVLLAIARLRSYLDDYDGRVAALLEAELVFRRWEHLRGRVLTLAELALPVGRAFALKDRIRYGQQGLRFADELGDDYLWSYCATHLGCARFEAGDVSALDLLYEARDRLDMSSQRDRNDFFRQCANLSMYHFFLGDNASSMSVLREWQSVVDEPFWERVLAFVKGLLAWRSGSWGEALTVFEEVSGDESPGYFRVGDSIRLSILLERGEQFTMKGFEDTATYLIAAQEDAWAALAFALCVQARSWRREPNPTRGLMRQAESIRKIGLRVGWQDLFPAVASSELPAYERLSQLLGELIPVGPHAEACRALAEGTRLARTEAEVEAVIRLEQAASVFEAIGDPYYEAKAREAMSRVAASGGLARASAQRAAEIYSDIGAARSLTRLVRGSRKRGLLTRHAIPPAQRGKGAPGLTDREKQVAELAGRGYTAEEIAREIVISPGTVQAHIKHIKAKLGIKRKSELVRLMQE